MDFEVKSLKPLSVVGLLCFVLMVEMGTLSSLLLLPVLLLVAMAAHHGGL